MIPQNYPAERLVFDICNNKEIGNGHGVCNICKGPTDWDNKSGRYKVYCSDKCRQEMRDRAVKNMIKVHGKATMLNDIEHQEKMLASRKISGKYKFTDGGVCVYTGSYEKKLLEFMDKVLNVSSGDLIAPGPVIEYDFNGEKKQYITDFFYVPYNLIIEVKDGGSNPNKVIDQSVVRQKTHAKEEAIIKLGKYNYLRLTNNNFVQLLDIFIDLKEQSFEEGDSNSPVYHINEYCANTPPMGFGGTPYEARSTTPLFITHYRDETTFTDRYYLSNDIISNKVIQHDPDTETLKKTPISKCKGKGTVFKYVGDDAADILSEVYSAVKNKTTVNSTYIPSLLTKSKILTPDQLYCTPVLEEVKFINNAARRNMETFLFECSYIRSGYKTPAIFSVLSPELYDKKNSILESYDNMRILQDINGYFAINDITGNRTKSVKNFDELTKETLDSIYV